MPEGIQSTVARYDAIIIGAGFSGLYQLHCLRDKLGLNVKLLEAGGGIGGTWYWNRYPGARCDSESHSYAYFFSKELLEEWEWSERYPGHAEIRRYLSHVADRFDLKRDMQFDARVTAAHYSDTKQDWTVETEAGERFQATYLIAAVGCLSSANVPNIPGRDDFAGDWYHTGRWPHEGVDFSGKRVGQIGTGSTGIQAVPVIAETAGHLTVFQRTANYSIPARNGPLSGEFKKYMRSEHDQIREVVQTTPNGHPFRISDTPALDVDPARRHALYEHAWETGGLRFRAIFQDLITNKEANDTASDFLKNKIREVVKDPETARVLSDIDHPFAAKRPPIDTHYFEAYNRDNVSLVDLRATPIERITANGIQTSDREYPLDIIVFATGFDAMTGTMLKIDITGRDGRTLKDAWHAGPRTYLGLQIPGFPNLFTLTGPGSPSVLCNMPVAIEQHVNWVTDCIRHMREHDHATIETTEDRADDWIAEVNRAADATLLPQANHSWYLGANVPGKPRIFMPYAGGMDRYRTICDEVVENGYDGFVLTKTGAEAAAD